MSGKRSDRLRSMIAATVTDAAENAAPVGITGASLPAPSSPKSRVKTLDDIAIPRPSDENRSDGQIATPSISLETTSPPVVEVAAPTSATDIAEYRAPFRAPARTVKPPKWEKANVTLEPQDLAILEHSDQQARSYGFRLRKGGNPSLFVRAGLRLLHELGELDPEAWIKRIAETTSTASEPRK